MTMGNVGEHAGAIVADVRRIVVLRANAVGDYVLTLPALQALKAAYPQASLTLLGKRWHAEFLDGRPGPVDEVVCLPAIPGVTAPADTADTADTADSVGTADTAEPVVDEGSVLRDFLARMQRRRFDLALQLHGGGRYSNPLVRALGARVTAGFCAPGACALDRNFPYLAPDIDLHPRPAAARMRGTGGRACGIDRAAAVVAGARSSRTRDRPAGPA